MHGLTKTAIFANSKGGVGKSTIALLMSLGLATRHSDSKIELIDLDPQATSSDSLRRFANRRFTVVQDESFFLGNGFPNNSKIINHIESKVSFKHNSNYMVFDSPAGSDPARSAFFLSCDIIFVPTSVSDADIFATKKFLDSLDELFKSEAGISSGKPPSVVILPTMVDSRDEFNELRTVLAHAPAYLGKPLYYSPLFRRAFRAEANDKNVRDLLLESADYIQWLTHLFVHSHTIKQRPKKLFQL
ncbi:ParA family protein [Porticoccaceae bacterium]|nr:ParA family protein [Porticoccaceae bacterium]